MARKIPVLRTFLPAMQMTPVMRVSSMMKISSTEKDYAKSLLVADFQNLKKV